MSLARYAVIVLGVAAGSLLAISPLLDTERRGALVYGAGLAAGNTLLAYYLVLWSARRSTTARAPSCCTVMSTS